MPFDAVSVLPCWAVPLIVGAAVLPGAAGVGAVTVALGAESAEVVPAALEAETTASTRSPTSLE